MPNDKKTTAAGAVVGAIALVLAGYYASGRVDCSAPGMQENQRKYENDFAACLAIASCAQMDAGQPAECPGVTDADRAKATRCLAQLETDFQKLQELCQKP